MNNNRYLAYTYDGQGYITTEKATENVSAHPSLTGDSLERHDAHYQVTYTDQDQNLFYNKRYESESSYWGW